MRSKSTFLMSRKRVNTGPTCGMEASSKAREHVDQRVQLRKWAR